MIFELFQALGLPFGLTVANANERNDRGNIHHSQCIRSFCANLAGGCQGAEDAGVVVKNALHIPLCVKRCQFRRTELLNAHHAAEAADGFVVKRVFKYLPHLFKKRIRSDFQKIGMSLCTSCTCMSILSVSASYCAAVDSTMALKIACLPGK